MVKSELILFKLKSRYLLDILYNERVTIYTDIRFYPFYNYRRYKDNRCFIVEISKQFKDQFLKFNKERYAMGTNTNLYQTKRASA